VRSAPIGEAVLSLPDPRRWFRSRKPSDGAVEDLLVGDLFAREHLERHARQLAGQHRIDPRGGRNRLLTRLDENATVIAAVHDELAAAVAAEGRLPPAAEWLLDNYYLVQEQIRLANRHLPRGYSRELPRLTGAAGMREVRIHQLALELIIHVDGRVDQDALDAFIAAYQQGAELTLGELWALPIMLRLALIENLRRVASRLRRARQAQAEATAWATRIIAQVELAPQDLVLELAELARAGIEPSSAFVAEFVRRLQGQAIPVGVALSWVESRLQAQGSSIEQYVHRESRDQAADQVSIAASIGSMRMLDALDWRAFVERHSAIDAVLAADPAGTWTGMDFASRDRCRHAAERLSRLGRRSERSVAEAVLALAGRAEGRARHVGYWLVDAGLPALERQLGAPPIRSLAERTLRAAPLAWYLGGTAALTGLATTGAVLAAAGLPAPVLWLVGACSALAASGPALALMQRLGIALLAPRGLARLDFTDGIPAKHRTVVAVPCLLGSVVEADRLCDRLEVHYLANRDSELRFALLSDWRDAASERTPGDDGPLARASERIRTLNEAYGRDGDRFFLLHRPRLWNSFEGCWMGRERKRGKLEDLNRLLIDGDDTAFLGIVGDRSRLAAVEHVLVLDADTGLPPGAAAALVGALAHPLNRPVVDPARRIVVAGHGILQPRVAVGLASAGRSWYARLAAGDPGIDPYTRAVSDLYQDLFDAGSFVGKGIYHLRAFDLVLRDRLPDNRILSHDLLEGCYLRAGLDSETILVEDTPARHLADMTRRHRWMRGDWQVARWILPAPPAVSGRSANPIDALGRWKLFDNLRRTLAPAAWVVLLAAAAAWPGGWPLLLALTVLHAVPSLIGPLAGCLARPAEAPVAAWLAAQARALGSGLAEALLTLAWLPLEAATALDATMRTLWRLAWSRRRLLAWTTAADAERAAARDLSGALAGLWSCPTLAAATAAGVWWSGASPWGLLLPGLWALAPVLSWWVSRPLRTDRTALNEADRRWLRLVARRTWRWFETFVGPDDHHLPPDNVQEVPSLRIAHRTSPTNIGLTLLADLGAHDLGYHGNDRLLTRIEATVTTLERLERHRGHFLNWYDTSTLEPLPPRYISTVDSGNLVGHLLVLRRGLIALADRPLWTPVAAEGLLDTAELAEDAARRAGLPVNAAHLSGLAARIAVAQPVAAIPMIAELATAAAKAAEVTSADAEAAWWYVALRDQAQILHDELAGLLPWLGRPVPTALAPALAGTHTLRAIARLAQDHAPDLAEAPPTLVQAIESASRRAGELLGRADVLATRLADLAEADFAILCDPQRHLFVIGYHVAERRNDNGHYDLLASEARLASYIAIARGQLDEEHWFRLGRQLADAGGRPALVSWSGSAFEYLMPPLIMPSHRGTLLDETCRAVVRRQIAYGAARGVPWGVSESGYHLTDQHLTYQYRAFGVPGLGLKRGLAEDLVIAPYATLMALPWAVPEGVANLRRLTAEGREGPYGFYEAIDYTPSRLPHRHDSAVVRQWMVHHQGMGFLGLLMVLANDPMQRRFRADPELRAVELLLHERAPRLVRTTRPNANEAEAAGRLSAEDGAPLRVITDPTAQGEINILSNGRYHVMLGVGGGGYSRWRDLAVTRWREDQSLEPYGTFIYLRDTDRGRWWTATHQPLRRSGKHDETIFTQARSEFRRRAENLECHTEIAVSPEDDVEVRRLTLRNLSRDERVIEVTSFAEVVLAPAAADAAHPAFSNLFVQTEILADRATVLATRRARGPGERPPWLLHLIATTAPETTPPSAETDRAGFLGRGRHPGDPAALTTGGPLGGGQGAVLDPAMAVRRTVRIPPDGTVVLEVVTGVHETREGAVALAQKYADPRLCDRVFELAWTHSQVTLRHLGVGERDAQRYAQLAGAVVHPAPQWRAPASLLARNRRGQSGLWGYGISGDLPIILLRIADLQHFDLVQESVRFHGWMRARGLITDLVVLLEDASGYRQALHDVVMGLLAGGPASSLVDRSGGVYVRRGDQMPEEDRVLFQAMARVVLNGGGGTFAEQLERKPRPEERIPAIQPTRSPPERIVAPQLRRDDLIHRNAWGGFTQDGREYVMVLPAGTLPPAPWVNVIANPHFGTVVSERGGGYTWLENSHEFRLTPWYNDPVGDRTGEGLWLRDEETGRHWSPTPGPTPRTGTYIVRHGFGYSVFEHNEDQIASEVWQFVAIDAPVKLISVRLRNHDQRPRRLAVAGLWEWVLGDLRSRTQMHVVTERDERSGAILARNPLNPDFPARLAFVDTSARERTVTGDRAEFLGRGGGIDAPAALKRVRLSNRTGAGLDPCAAILATIEIPPGQEREVVFVLGVGRDVEDVQRLLQRFRSPAGARASLEAVWQHWNRVLGTVHVETPDRLIDPLVNGWLEYQIISSRLWGRTGLYQSGGAYGFRDQLQDAMAVAHTAPELLREHLLRAAAHQFREGDVQHWWHPPSGRGVRTHFSDDYLWLPLAIARHVAMVADTGVLDETVPFLDGRPVKADEESYYDLPEVTDERATLYEHGARAIDRAIGRTGPHGLPLIGCGDWNDGMNLVGAQGRGESVWLAFFIISVVDAYMPLARRRGEHVRVSRWLAAATSLRERVETAAWDGEWYRRASTDDGRWLGSAGSAECRIDSLPQSWAVLSGAAPEARARQAMQAVDRLLVDRDHRLIRLFDPPFDSSDLEPGYIKGYVPGVRENGGQYTHAAVWTAMAFARLGDAAAAWELAGLINPTGHASGDGATRYRVEPYVLAADVYGVAPHTGRGGWTWYTGSAGWYLRLLIEELLGVCRRGDRLELHPLLPQDWSGFTLHYRHGRTFHHLTFTRTGPGQTVLTVRLDGVEQPDRCVPLTDDGRERQVAIAIG